MKYTSGLAGTVMYMILVYLMIKYLFIYFKRYLTVNILAIIAPIIGIAYSMDKLKDNKSQSLTSWLLDFIFSVLIQSVHAIIYTMFVPIALEASEESLVGIVFAFILLNFMPKADKIFTHIFNMNRGQAISNILKGDGKSQLFAKLNMVRGVGKVYKTGIKYTGKAVKGVGTTIGEIGGIVVPANTRYSFNNWYNTMTDSVLGENNFLPRRRTSDTQTVSGIDNKINEVKRQYRMATLRQIKKPISMGMKGIKYTAISMAAIPMMVIEPSKGIKNMMMITGYKELFGAGEKKKYSTHKSKKGLNNIIANRSKKVVNGNPNDLNNKNKKSKRARKIDPSVGHAVGSFTGAVAGSVVSPGYGTMLGATAGGMAGVGATIPGAYSQLKKEGLSMSAKFAKSIEMLEQAKSVEIEIINQYNEVKQDVKSRFGTNGTQSQTAEKVSASMMSKLNKQYDKMIEDIFKEVDSKDIEKTVKEYLKEESKDKIRKKDIDAIIEKLETNLNKKEKNSVPLSVEKLRENVDKVIENNGQKEITKKVKKDLGNSNSKWEEIDDNKQKLIIKDIQKALKEKDNKDDLVSSLEKSLADNNITVDISTKEKKSIVSNITSVLENKQKSEYTSKEIVNLLKKGCKKKGSIKKDPVLIEFREIAQNVEKLAKINDEYNKEFGKPIFTKDEIVGVIKKTRKDKK